MASRGQLLKKKWSCKEQYKKTAISKHFSNEFILSVPMFKFYWIQQNVPVIRFFFIIVKNNDKLDMFEGGSALWLTSPY